MERPYYDPFPDTPAGKNLPIACRYPFTATLPKDERLPSVDKRLISPLHDTPIPEGWSQVWMRPDDERLKNTVFDLAEVWIDKETGEGFSEKAPGRNLGAWLILVSDEGVPVATWDEGRWWTPAESELFHLLLRVPGATEIERGGPFGMGLGWEAKP